MRRIGAIITAYGAENIYPRPARLAPLRVGSGPAGGASGGGAPAPGPADRAHGSAGVPSSDRSGAPDSYLRRAEEQRDRRRTAGCRAGPLVDRAQAGRRHRRTQAGRPQRGGRGGNDAGRNAPI